MSTVYDYSVFTPKGEEVKLSAFKGKVLVIVNTATGCGFTPQYEPLEKMYEAYHDRGLEIIDIPCNQFGGQAPGSDDEIHEFCTLNYDTQFEQFKKSNVNGPDELPLYTFLKAQKGFAGFGEGHKLAAVLDDMLGKADPDYAKKPDIKWNFTKFVVDRAGNVVARFEPTADMKAVEDFVVSLL
ncbi:MAG: glutathione peroxidase [Synergistaceae bacterium]|nr:glutathione peroxidase [Synergistaceae bacterium]